MTDNDPYGLNYKTLPPEVGDPHTITQRLMRAMLTSEDKSLLIEKLDRDLSRHKELVKEAMSRLRALEVGYEERFTREQAKELFKELFKDDLHERGFLARLVKIVYIPVGIGILIDIIVRVFTHG